MISALLTLALLVAPAGAADRDVKDVLSAFRRERIRDPIAEKILRLTPPNAPTRATFLVPVKSPGPKPPHLSLYVYRPGERPKALSDPRGKGNDSWRFDALLAMEAVDVDGDGLLDLSLKVRYRTPQGKLIEKSALYHNDGVAGFRLAGSAGPPPAKKKRGFPLASDCRFAGLDGGWWIAVCPGESETEQIQLRKDGEIRFRIDIPAGSQVEVLGQDPRAVAVSYEGTECQVIKVVRLKDGGLAADTDCTPATYCSLSRFPKAPECKGIVECGGGSGGFRWKREFDICQ